MNGVDGAAKINYLNGHTTANGTPKKATKKVSTKTPSKKGSNKAPTRVQPGRNAKTPSKK